MLVSITKERVMHRLMCEEVCGIMHEVIYVKPSRTQGMHADFLSSLVLSDLRDPLPTCWLWFVIDLTHPCGERAATGVASLLRFGGQAP